MAPGVWATEAGEGQWFLVGTAPGNESVPAATRHVFTPIAGVLREHGLQVVQERVFGSLSARAAVLEARNAALAENGLPWDGPVTYIQGHPIRGEGLAGVIVRAVREVGPSDRVWTIRDGGVARGRGWQRKGLSHLVLQNIEGLVSAPGDNKAPAAQARRMLERADHLLCEQGSTWRDVVRTWFYLSDILRWYGEFNAARNGKFVEFGLLPGPESDGRTPPASTGIAGDNPVGAAGTLDLVAVNGPAGARPRVTYLSNPLQKDAFRYGSAFSRGAVVHEADVDLIEVSGLAAIDAAGRSLHPGDVRAQIDDTLNRLQALLVQANAGLQDICAATLFLKRREDAEILRSEACRRGFDSIPAVCVIADICRDELLFELDAEAAIPGGRPE